MDTPTRNSAAEWPTSPPGRRRRGIGPTRSGLEYVGQATIARHFGVGRAAVCNWIKRDVGVPQPDALVDDVPVWLRSRLSEWERWHSSLA